MQCHNIRWDTFGSLNFGSKRRPGLVASQKIYTSITSMFGHMHGVLNVDEKNHFHKLSVNCETNLMSLISS